MQAGKIPTRLNVKAVFFPSQANALGIKKMHWIYRSLDLRKMPLRRIPTLAISHCKAENYFNYPKTYAKAKLAEPLNRKGEEERFYSEWSTACGNKER